MRILFFDDIAEVHVAAGLARALLRLGIEVVQTGPFWRGHKFPIGAVEEGAVAVALEEALALQPDVLLLLRPMALSPRLLDRLPAHRPLRVAWLSDDPALFRVYIAVAERYHLLLHGGCGEATLDLYRRHGVERGAFFPFWADPDDFQAPAAPQAAREASFVFVGNCSGRRKRDRYDTLVGYAGAAGFGLAIYGRVDGDPRGVARGFIRQSDLPAEVMRYAAALNIPQDMRSYAGGELDFPGLSEMGWFDVPSRLVQMAALAMPVVTLGPDIASRHFPTPLGSAAADSRVRFDPATLADPAKLEALGHAAHAEFLANFTADLRARYLLRLLERPPAAVPMGERIYGYRGSAP